MIEAYICKPEDMINHMESHVRPVSITEEEWMELRDSIRKGIPLIDWKSLPDTITHMVFFSEFRGEDGRILRVEAYVDGAYRACTEESFRQYQRSGYYTLAIHRR